MCVRVCVCVCVCVRVCVRVCVCVCVLTYGDSHIIPEQELHSLENESLCISVDSDIDPLFTVDLRCECTVCVYVCVCVFGYVNTACLLIEQ